MKILIPVLFFFSSCMAHADAVRSKVQIGKMGSRALWTIKESENGDLHPAVILVTGTGAHGPEEMMPGAVTSDGKEAPLFDQFAAPLNEAGVATLQLGKPGVEFFTGWNPATFFYDQGMYQRLHWTDLLDALSEAVNFVRSQPGIDPKRVYVFGHSEGTQLAADYAKRDPSIAGIILVGFAGESLGSIAEYQVDREAIERWIVPDVDINHDGFISAREAAVWPELKGLTAHPELLPLAIADLRSQILASPASQAALQRLSDTPLYADGILFRDPLYEQIATLAQAVFVFTGDLDQNVDFQQSLNQKAACEAHHKENCFVKIMPGLCHGMSLPKAPRKQFFLDASLGPVDSSFELELKNIGLSL